MRQRFEEIRRRNRDFAMLSSDRLRDGSRVRKLVRLRLGKTDGKGLNRTAHLAAHHRRERTRINSA
jgi:hypothetical protein